LQCIGLRLDERIKTLKDLLKEEWLYVWIFKWL
jgi:hypothetical protein